MGRCPVTAILQPQPAACAACGRPFAQPFCPHVLTALATLAADPRELRTLDEHFADADALFTDRLLDEADAIVISTPVRRRGYSTSDLRRGYCPTAAYYAVRRKS
jgi:hypothetical protein